MEFNIYKLLRPILFQMDPESAHELVMSLAPIAQSSLLRTIFTGLYEYEDPRLEVEVFGLKFKNPIGLAAGIDKSARALDLLAALGPGAIEVGVVSAKAQPGNEKPRIYRFPAQGAIINRMGNPNIGADAVVPNLILARKRNKHLPPIGLNIGKTTITALDDAAEDYLYTFRTLYSYVDYFIINVSCPNVADFSKMQEKARLDQILGVLKAANVQKKPILIKVAPDLEDPQLDDVLDSCFASGVAGIIATNTTLSREGLPTTAPSTGGMSGSPLFAKSHAMVLKLSKRMQGRLPIVAVGGIRTVDDIISMFSAGASLVELYTALVYEGPSLIGHLKRQLVNRMERDGVTNLLSYRDR